jgi:hypothetical protein
MRLDSNTLILSFDVESVGLHGDGFAVGYVVNKGREEIASGYFACPDSAACGTAASRKWIHEHVAPALPQSTHETLEEVRKAFWAVYQDWKSQGAVFVADCPWPVEAKFLINCVNDDSTREWEGPYPLIDVGSVLLASGHDPLKTFDRAPNELPAHHPTMDARQSMRILLDCMGAK